MDAPEFVPDHARDAAALEIALNVPTIHSRVTILWLASPKKRLAGAFL
jgi:hypothetical protein